MVLPNVFRAGGNILQWPVLLVLGVQGLVPGLGGPVRRRFHFLATDGRRSRGE